MKLHLRATGCHLPYGITQCYLPPGPTQLKTAHSRIASSSRIELDCTAKLVSQCFQSVFDTCRWLVHIIYSCSSSAM